MKFSIVTDMLGKESFDEALQEAKNLKFDYVELRAKLDGDTIDSISVDKAKQLGQKVKEHGLKVSTLSSWAINPCTFSGPPRYDNYDDNHHQAMEKELDRLLDLADALDAENVRIYSLYRSPEFDQLSENEQEEQYKHNAAMLNKHVKHATERGKTILVENEPPTLANTIFELGKLIKYADNPQLRLNWDIVNGWRAGEYPTPVLYERHIQGYVGSVHLKGASQLVNSVSNEMPEGRFNNFAIAGRDDFKHEEILKALVSGDPDVILTIDTHYPSFYQQDKIGEVEVVRLTKEFIENLLK
ncbi:sugar phosphate isomerase/epimerase family protein [Salipaludibacillus sp. CF4.18]|uniref:sugar phosphate isomerase/epimerase family protein n=1 Tax=Salipaludibacillus sp. CF4.18 TaxID=3373081 RepID=UPI003EE646AA